MVVMDRGGVGARKRGEERKKEKNKDTGRLRNGVFPCCTALYYGYVLLQDPLETSPPSHVTTLKVLVINL